MKQYMAQRVMGSSFWARTSTIEYEKRGMLIGLMDQICNNKYEEAITLKIQFSEEKKVEDVSILHMVVEVESE